MRRTGGRFHGRHPPTGQLETADAFRAVIGAYAGLGVVLAVLFLGLTPAVELKTSSRAAILGLHRSKSVVFRLSSLFALDAFGGGFVVQSVAAYWFHARFGVSPPTLGAIFFGANVLAGLSALVAVPLARRIGLIATMVFTHIPSNVLLILVPLMPTLDVGDGRVPAPVLRSRRWTYQRASRT